MLKFTIEITVEALNKDSRFAVQQAIERGTGIMNQHKEIQSLSFGYCGTYIIITKEV